MDSSKYSMYKFFNLVNQNFFYKLYEPIKPNDNGIIKLWVDKLDKKYITILTNTKVINLNTENNKIVSITTENNKIFYANRYILCIPPRPMYELLYNSHMTNTFKNNFKKWVDNNSYNDYICITFHFNNKINIKKKLEYPNTKNGLIYIIMSNYFIDENNTIISTSLSILDDDIHNLNKNELIDETYKQLIMNIPELNNIRYDKAILNPNVYKINNKWVSNDTAFISTIYNKYLKQESKDFINLFNVGTQNNYNRYDFTTIESTIVNALYFIKKYHSKYDINIIYGKELKEYILKIIILVLMIIILIIIYKY
jgi:hypothetical protein